MSFTATNVYMRTSKFEEEILIWEVHKWDRKLSKISKWKVFFCLYNDRMENEGRKMMINSKTYLDKMHEEEKLDTNNKIWIEMIKWKDEWKWIRTNLKNQKLNL